MGLPHNFSEAIGSTSFLKFDMFQLANVGCLARHVNYHVQILVTSMVPVMVCGLLFVVGFFVKKLRGVCKTVVLVISYAVLPSVSTTVFGAFPCDELDTGESFLIADYSINCNSASYSTFAAFAGLMLVVYPLGIPLMYSWLLVQKKEKIKKEVRVREADEDLIGMEFLFDNYRPECWYFEIVVTVLRLMMTGVLGLIEPGSATQLSCGMMMAIAGMLVSSWYMPYLEKRDNVLSTLSYVQIFFVMLCALVLKSQEFAEGVDKEGLGVVLIIVNAFLLIITVVTVVVNFFGQMDEDYESDNSKLSGTLMNMFKKKTASSWTTRKKKEEGEGEKGGGMIELGDVFVERSSSFVVDSNPLARTPDLGLEGFQKFTDEKSGREYYVNEKNGETLWDTEIEGRLKIEGRLTDEGEANG